MRIIGIGTEIIECVRIAKMIERHGEMFLERVYTSAEVAYCTERSSAIQHFAARWAAKEAVLKALDARSRGLKWNEISVAVDNAGRATIHLSGKAEHWAKNQGVERLELSLGRCRTHATAFVVAMSAAD